MRRSEARQGVRIVKFVDVSGRWDAAELNQLEAAALLGVGERTFRRWCRRYEEKGEPSCSVPECDGAKSPLTRQEEEALWQAFFTAARPPAALQGGRAKCDPTGGQP